MPHPSFSIEVAVSIQPANIRQEIEDIFDAVWRGERGSDETKAEFIERKLEQHVLDIYGSRKSQSAGAEITRTLQKEITEGATIKQKKEKPVEVVKPEGIGDTVPKDK